MSDVIEPLVTCCQLRFGESKESVRSRLGPPSSVRGPLEFHLDAGVATYYMDGHTLSGVRVHRGLGLEPILFGSKPLAGPKSGIVDILRERAPDLRVLADEVVSNELELRLWGPGDTFELVECGQRGFLERVALEGPVERRRRLEGAVLAGSPPRQIREEYDESITDFEFLALPPLDTLEKISLAETGVSDLTASWIASCLRVEEVFVGNTQVTSAGLLKLAELPSLRRLGLSGLAVSAEVLRALGTRPSLRELFLDGVELPYESWVAVGQITQLQRLYLNGTNLDDAGLTALARLTGLELLDLNDTLVSLDGAEGLRAKLPKCRIGWLEA